jgi:hypothetical protein
MSSSKVAGIMTTQLPVTRKRSLAPFKIPNEYPLPGNYDSAIDGRHYANEDLINLRDWLNDASGTTAYDRVVNLIADLRKLQSDYDTTRRSLRRSTPSRSELDEMSLFENRLQQIRNRLKRYTFSLRAADRLSVRSRSIQISLWPDKLTDDFTPGPKLRRDSDRSSTILNPGTQRMSEGGAVLCFTRLFEAGDSGRLKLCEKCNKKWIAATKSHYRFCSDKCREDTYAASEEYRKRKRDQMRRQRRAERVRGQAPGGTWRKG